MKRLVPAFLHRFGRLWRRRPKGRKGALVLAFGAAGTATGILFLTAGHVERSAAPYLFTRLADVGRHDVAIVPGCRVYGDGRPSPMLEDRLATALDAYREDKVAKILVSGTGGATEHDEAEAMRLWLEERGVPAADLLSDAEGFRTLDTMARAKSDFGVASAIVCTQRFHLARSVFLARRFGIDAEGIVADRRAYAGIRLDQVRETYARSVAFFEVYALRKGAGR